VLCHEEPLEWHVCSWWKSERERSRGHVVLRLSLPPVLLRPPCVFVESRSGTACSIPYLLLKNLTQTGHFPPARSVYLNSVSLVVQ
jgi:hypothetical protein